MALTLIRPLRVAGIGAAALAAGLLAPQAAMAEPPPGCTAADFASVAGGVATSTSGYLFAHPDVNAFYTGLRDRPDGEVAEAVRGFFADNPQAHSDLLGIRAPMVEFRSRCGIAEPDRPLLSQ